MMKKKQWRAGEGRFGVFAVVAVCLMPVFAGAQTLVLSNGYHSAASLAGTTVTMTGRSELHITGSGTPVSGCTINLNSIDSWVFLHRVNPASTASLLGQFKVNGANAVNNGNVKLVQYVQGTVVIPYPSNFQPMTIYDGENFSGDSLALSPNSSYGAVLGGQVSSFILKRGYTATFAQNSNGTGKSVNYVAADGDLRIGALPNGLNNQVRFIRIFPWRWVGKKGSCDVGPDVLKADWYYNWNISGAAANSNYEYVAIKQQPSWPGLGQDWAYMGVNHLSGFNEPNNPVEDAYKNLTPVGDVDNAVARQPELLGTGLRLGTPAVTDGGYNWIVDYVNKAEAAGYRMDYVPIHYYRSYWNNDDPAGAATQLYNFLKSIYDATHKPIWLTEFNNGANWTDDAHDPNATQNRNVIEAMINKMDAAPWIERYAIYSRVEWFRQTHYDDGSITPMGQMYKDHVAPMAYQQILPGAGMEPSATYAFENNLDDGSGSGNHALSKNHPDYVAGRNAGTTAIALDGVDDHVILPDSLSDGTDFTFAAWVYWNGGSAWQRIFDFGIVDSGKYMFLTPSNGGGALRFAINNGSGEQLLTASSALPLNTWTHVAVTLGGNTGRLYVNGAQVAINTSMSINPINLGAIQHYLGKSMFPNDPYFSGRIDDVIIKNQALSAAQVALLAAGNQPPQATTQSIDAGSVQVGASFSGTVSGTVTDPEAGAITYGKIYGSAWLTVASDGSLSGTPGYQDAGAQHFTVRATDSSGACTYLLLHANVQIPSNAFELGPVAYWDFADAGAANGAYLPGNGDRADLDGDGAMDSDDFRIGSTDLSGNGNHLTAWTSSWMKWSSISTLGDFSMVPNNNWPAAGTDSAYNPHLTGIDAEAITPTNWTVEAVFKCLGANAENNNQTIVGRDGYHVGGSSSGSAALYLSIRGSELAIEYTDVSGIAHVAQTSGLGFQYNQWYAVAAVSDGSTLSLWVNGFVAASTDMIGSSADTALGLGYGSWSVARGMRNGTTRTAGHTERFNGQIDAVAISGVALWPGSFVIGGTWPSAYDFYVDDYGIPGALFEDDANSNGVPNGMEYYLGWNPANPETTNSILAFADDYLSVVHPFNPSASGVTGTVQWTTDLLSSNWYSSGVTYFTNTEPDEIEAWLEAATTNDALFIRLKVDN